MLDHELNKIETELEKSKEEIKEKSKLLLICFDEFEKIEECILKGSLTEAILNELRHIMQHRKHFVILVICLKILNHSINDIQGL